MKTIYHHVVVETPTLQPKDDNNMKNVLQIQHVEEKILSVRGEKVLLDSDVATLYEVQTKEINQAVKNNPDKFPEGYIIQMDKAEWQNLKSKFLTSSKNELVTNCDLLNGETPLRSQIVTLKDENELVKNFDQFNRKHSSSPPKAFTEKGLYMLATILKGKQAAQTTIAIVEAYSKIRELARTVARLAEADDKFKQQTLMQKSGEIMADILGEGMKKTDSETSIELNLAVLKFKHTVKRKPNAT